MIECKRAHIENLEELRNLWKICFESDENFLRLYFQEGILLTFTYILAERGKAASALSVFQIEYNGHKGGYVYGVCTHPDFRGRGYASRLLKYAESDCEKNGMNFFVLRPASKPLFDYYGRLGYNISIDRGLKTYRLDELYTPIDFKPITATELFDARASFLESNFFRWSKEELEYIIKYIKYCGGEAIMDKDKYLVGYPDGNNYLVLETNFETENSCRYVKSLHNACTTVNISSRATKFLHTPFALFKSNSFRPLPYSFFNFPME